MNHLVSSGDMGQDDRRARMARRRSVRHNLWKNTFEDIRSLAHPVLRHRVLTNFRAESEGITSDSIIDDLLSAVATPRSGM